MFDGVPDQFHHFIASSRAPLQIPFPFPLHATTSPPPPPPPQPPPPPATPLAQTFPTFDPYPSHQTLQPHQHHQHHQHQHHHLHHHLPSAPPPPQPKNEGSKEDQTTTLLSTSLVLERERSSSEPGGPWSNEEVLALLRIRSSMENWFPDYTWEHVSRKLAELGFKRSPEKCKERFEEENRNLNSLSFNKNSFRFFSELDELYQHQGGDHKNQQNEESVQTRNINNQPPALRREAVAIAAEAQSLEEGSGNVDHNSTTSRSSKSNNNNGDEKKRKRKGKRKRELEMFKGFCEEIVERIMAQQEELHTKIIEDMVKREEEKIARDEAWKSQERERLNKEIEAREKEHEIASNRQAKIIEFLNKFASSSPPLHSPLDQSLFDKFNDLFDPPNNNPKTPSSTHPHNEIMGTKKTKKVSSFPHQNPTSNNPTQSSTNPSFTSPTETLIMPSMDLGPENHPTPQSKDTQLEPNTQNGGGDIGKRWPREEVLALINMRCSLNNNNNNSDNSSKDGAKGPLWERISQGMQELGYNRSAKRCKEKWENINKYFRKTKDNNKKRSVDSRTCPYFHQLSSLYSQGKLRGDSPENRSSAD